MKWTAVQLQVFFFFLSIQTQASVLLKSTLQVDGGLHISVPLCGYDDGSIWINNHFDDKQQGKLGQRDSTHGLFYPSLPPCTNLFSSLSITIKNFPLSKLVLAIAVHPHGFGW